VGQRILLKRGENVRKQKMGIKAIDYRYYCCFKKLIFYGNYGTAALR
jgi:hypothetical protein